MTPPRLPDAAPGAGRRRSRRHSAAVALATVVVWTVVALALGEVVLRLALPEWRDFSSGRFMRKEAVPGYGTTTVGRAGFDGYFAQNNGDFRVRIRLNRAGLRNPEPVAAADGRIWTVGDSITFGWGVDRAAMYATVIARASGRPVYNVASPGTDVCGYQALVARMPPTVRPAAVVVGLVMENDIAVYRCPRGRAQDTAPPAAAARRRWPTLMDVKLFLTARSALYNFVAIAVKRIDALDRLLVAVGLVERPQGYRRSVDPKREKAAVESTAGEIAFLRSMLPAEAPFAVLIVPARFDIRDRDPLNVALRRDMTAALAARGIAVIDPTPAFRAAGFAPTHFAHDGHWSPLGHRIAGRAAAAWLRAALTVRPPTGPSPVRRRED